MVSSSVDEFMANRSGVDSGVGTVSVSLLTLIDPGNGATLECPHHGARERQELRDPSGSALPSWCVDLYFDISCRGRACVAFPF